MTSRMEQDRWHAGVARFSCRRQNNVSSSCDIRRRKNECNYGGFNMTVKAVQLGIQHARDVIEEWAEAGLTGWRETQTRYATIDPIIRALGWDTEDPKECYPEYDLSEGKTRPDYALFGDWSAEDIAESVIAPVVIIEAKALRLNLMDKFVDKLEQIHQGRASDD